MDAKKCAYLTGLIFTLSVACVATEVEETNTSTPPEAAKPCTGKIQRAFDFWIGQWEVTSPAREGWRAESSITLSNNGCSIHEHYTTPGGYEGKSINFYDPNKKLWHQTWVDNQGVPLYLEGNFSNGTMVLSDATNRVSWSVQPDKSVRQHWEATEDEGKTWTTAFDGYYRPRKVE